MTYIHNDPKDFFDEMLVGFAAAYPDRIATVPGGVIRATAVPMGQVAVIIGGGSGHYPAFAGLVGPGLAHAAAMGNIFASPSAHAVYSVAKSANKGAGVLLTYGNYAGDCINFDEAQQRLIDEGIPCRTVTVTDDISSAPGNEWQKRRGIAGDLCVFKAAAWAAEQGRPLDAVYEMCALANSMTRSFGIAFSGCTLPGASAPLFTVPKGRMGVGMGIHGETGLHEDDIISASGIAEMLVRELLEQAPADRGTDRVAVLTNGLGSISHEELFVLHGYVDMLLRASGLTPVDPDVGELCTSLDMAGVSLTLCWLQGDLEQAWLAPADTPAYRKGAIAPRSLSAPALIETEELTHTEPADPGSQAAARVGLRAIQAAAARINLTVDELGALDAIAGDGDHGIGMARGVNGAAAAAVDLAAHHAGLGALLIGSGDAWSDRAGGTSGALWGLMLTTMGSAIGDAHAPDALGVAHAVDQARRAVIDVGKAEIGDKTMVDALTPFADSLLAGVSGGATLADAWAEAAATAEAAASATAQLLPKKGRARPHAEQAVGTPDPGAVSLASIVSAISEVLKQEVGND